MANKTGKYIYIILLLFVLSVGINNKAALSEESSGYFRQESNSDMYKLEPVLPQGWRYKIYTSDLHFTRFTEDIPEFTLIIDNPYITCKEEIKYKQYANVSFGLTLYFHNKWNMSKWADFDKQLIKLHSSAEAVSAPALFIETDKYTVFTSGGLSCPGKPIQELEDYLKSYFKKYNDSGVNAIVRAIQEDAIKTAVLRYQYEQNPFGLPQDIEVCFVSVGDPVLESDPTDDFLKRFQGLNLAVKKVSQCKFNASVEDAETGLKGKICQVKNIIWINDAEVEVSGGIYFGLLAAGGYIYHVVWENNEWIVKEAQSTWFS